MNQKGDMLQMLDEGIMGAVALMVLTLFLTPIIAYLAPQLLNAEIFPLGGITLFFCQAIILFVAIAWVRSILRGRQTPPQYPGFG